jgi:hypothetical protein
MDCNSLFPIKCAWPDAIEDVRQAAPGAKAIRLRAKARGIGELPRHAELRALWCHDIDARGLEAIGGCSALEALYIENLRTDDASALLRLSKLQVLSIEGCSRIASIPDFAALQNLRGLGISHFSKVHDLAPLARLHNLTALAVSGSLWKKMTVRSFAPLAALTNLTFLHLTNIKALDGSLDPLRGLSRLQHLDIANFYTTREFSGLASALRATECTWFRPIVEIGFAECGQCGGRKVMLTGKGASMVCPRCKAKKIEAHIVEWNEAARHAA